MHQLQHVLYITEQDAELALSGQSLRVIRGDKTEQTIPLHILEGIVSFSYMPATPALMEACAKRQIKLVFLTQTGRFRYQIAGETRGNVLLRRQQYRLADSEDARVKTAKNILHAKISGELFLLGRFRRNHPAANNQIIIRTEDILRSLAPQIDLAADTDKLFGIEGAAAKQYFLAFDEMILRARETFRFCGRSRRPPEDPCNAMLSFAYTLLSMECTQALECVGLDPYVGFYHRERPGKPALALDMMEEFRSTLADRFVLRLINLQMVQADMFERREDGGVNLNGAGRKVFLCEWNRFHLREVHLHSLGKSVPQGLLPHLQAQNLAQLIRGQTPSYSQVGWR